MNSTEWALWGDDSEPISEGTEKEVKQTYLESDDQHKLYVQAPDGTEWEHDGKQWIETS